MQRVDPHIHFGGTIQPQFVWEIIRENNWKHLAETYADVQSAMQFATDEPVGFHRFLNKFKILDQILWDETLIDRSILSVCDYLEANDITYAWMRFSINKYMDTMTWHKKEAIRFIYDAFQRHRPNKVGLLLSLKYESMQASQRQYAKLIEDPDIAECLIGIDLVGDETFFNANFYRSIFNDWLQTNKIICAHVGESQSANNIAEAIKIGVKHIAHGIKIIEEPYFIELAKDKNICFDLAITSNYMTGVCYPINHPALQMFNHGLKITVGTDDPVQCNTDLDMEYKQLAHMGFAAEQIATIKQQAIDNTIAYGLL